MAESIEKILKEQQKKSFSVHRYRPKSLKWDLDFLVHLSKDLKELFHDGLKCKKYLLLMNKLQILNWILSPRIFYWQHSVYQVLAFYSCLFHIEVTQIIWHESLPSQWLFLRVVDGVD